MATLVLQVEQMLFQSPRTGRGAPSSQPLTVSVPAARSRSGAALVVGGNGRGRVGLSAHKSS